MKNILPSFLTIVVFAGAIYGAGIWFTARYSSVLTDRCLLQSLGQYYGSNFYQIMGGK